MQCWPSNELETVTVNWTVGGQPASATTCVGLPSELGVEFGLGIEYCPDSPNDGGISTPLVPCTAGMVIQNRVPTAMSNLQVVGGGQILAQTYDGQATTSLDIPCVQDTDEGDVCSIVGTYQPASDVEAVEVMWTVNGQPANASSCGGPAETFALQLSDVSDANAYGVTVQCADGAFSASKVPTELQTLMIYGELGLSPYELLGSATLANGSATLDLMP
jgi:hypothetical protein